MNNSCLLNSILWKSVLHIKKKGPTRNTRGVTHLKSGFIIIFNNNIKSTQKIDFLVDKKQEKPNHLKIKMNIYLVRVFYSKTRKTV